MSSYNNLPRVDRNTRRAISCDSTPAILCNGKKVEINGFIPSTLQLKLTDGSHKPFVAFSHIPTDLIELVMDHSGKKNMLKKIYSVSLQDNTSVLLMKIVVKNGKRYFGVWNSNTQLISWDDISGPADLKRELGQIIKNKT